MASMLRAVGSMMLGGGVRVQKRFHLAPYLVINAYRVGSTLNPWTPEPTELNSIQRPRLAVQ